MRDLFYSFTCNCGIKISAANEKGLRKLLTIHMNEGQMHEIWKSMYDIKDKPLIHEALLMAKKVFDEPLESKPE